jgi:TonB family protein
MTSILEILLWNGSLAGKQKLRIPNENDMFKKYLDSDVMAEIDWWRAPLTRRSFYMRKLIVAILSLSSVMLHAQANTPAQTQVASDGSAAQVKRISTGVIAPKLIYKVDVVADTSTARLLSDDTKVVVGMIVDKTGRPSDLKIIKSAGPGVDASVLAAVSQYRFTPGMVSNQPIASPLNLEVVISTSYR